MRFAAAGGVLVNHATNLIMPDRAPLWDVPWSMGVDLFFVISGFIMAWLTKGQFGKPGAAPRYLLRRIIRIVPPYWFFTAVLIVVVVLSGGQARNTTIDSRQIATSFAFVPWPRHDGTFSPILAVGWTLNYEMFFYVCFAAALMTRSGLAWLVGAFAAFALVHPLVPPSWFVLKFLSDPIILEFVGGIGLARLYAAGVRLSWFGTVLCVAAGALAFVLLRDSHYTERAVVLGIPALPIAAAFVLSPEPRRLGPIGRILMLGGDSSYTLYLSHAFVLNAVVLLWLGMGGRPTALTMITAMLAAIIFAMIFYRLVEAPFSRWLGGRLQLPVASGAASVAP